VGATASLLGGEIYGLVGLGALVFLGMALTVPPFLAGLRLHESKVGVYEAAGSDSFSGESTVVISSMPIPTENIEQ
jgi:hypothetical protein